MRGLIKRRNDSVWEFLIIPSLIVVGFVILAELVDWLDNHAGPQATWGFFRLWLSQYVGDTQAAIGVLTAIAGSLFTVTSLTFSILLLAVQQGATVLNSQIVDHYLRRKSNRAWFGFFVGVSLFVLITLVQTTHTKTPVFGVMVSTFLGALALTALIVLIYGTVDQTRPMTVIDTIVEAAKEARVRQLQLLAAAAPLVQPAAEIPILCPADGYLVKVDFKALERALASEPAARLYLTKPIGSFLPAGTRVAWIGGATNVTELPRRVLEALMIRVQRDITHDPAYSLDHLATIGWTAISTAHSDPAVGAIVIHALQRLLHAWATPVQRAQPTATQIF
ncbi:putative membrane protein (DUF2254) [Terriglobus roseus DSM 18391]|uniref:Putative membrane protein (DUF2254) n=1 Tax=Terriglobus roseus (strain DSM 18391 / NRRL B-41598 / KBS 63) TaxID=926566 RepID=I3ZIU8_TERRK|nr:putative membrane protein (DUF2254) [Terriglobus roseus DSM 18391]